MIMYKILILTIVAILLMVSTALFFKNERLRRLCEIYNKQLQTSKFKLYNENDEVIFLNRFSFGALLMAAGLLLIYLQL